MDTLDFYKENSESTARLALHVGFAAMIVLSLPLLFGSPIMADDIRLAHAPVPSINIDTGQIYAGIAETISPQAKIERFNKSVAKRYPNAVIKDVDTGVKHIRMTRYYDGRPVKINVVEIDRGLAKNYELKPLRGVFHCFNGSKETAMQILEMGFYLGIGGVLTFKNCKLGEQLAAIGEEVLINRLVLETDAPYMAPVPHRGERNESRFMRGVAEKLGEVLKIDPKKVIEATKYNSKRLFRLK